MVQSFFASYRFFFFFFFFFGPTHFPPEILFEIGSSDLSMGSKPLGGPSPATKEPWGCVLQEEVAHKQFGKCIPFQKESFLVRG